MSASFFIGVDVGSASVRAGIYDAQGRRLTFAVRPIAQFHIAPNQVEQSSEDIWSSVCQVVQTCVQNAGVSPESVCSIGFDATCSLVAVGEKGKGISISETGDESHDIMMWMDHRATYEAQKINATRDPALEFVGGEVSVEMELPKVCWLKRHFPERYQQAWRLFDLADYLVWRATGNDVASVCTLSCKWNYLSHEKRFSQSLLERVGLPDLPKKIPTTILQPGELAGYLRTDVAQAFGLTTKVVVASGMIDAHAGGLALVGSQPEHNLALIGGTSNCHMLVSPQPVNVPGVWGPYWGAMLPGWWLSEGGQSAAGALVEWTLRQSDAWPELHHEAEKSGESIYAIVNRWVDSLEKRDIWPTAQLHVLADHHGNRSPRANPLARGAVSGLTLEQGTDALARYYLATLQAIAYGTRHIIETMAQAGHVITQLTVCGGVTKNPTWLREYANITGLALHLCADDDVVTLGAAITGAVACGAFKTLTDAAKVMVHQGDIITPNPSTFDFHQAKYQAYIKMYEHQQHIMRNMQAWCEQ
ncbi:FGGY-family carbohydrate kinase [Mangrovibacter yixingensis]|uniref:FGGY-family carbohydrate kinase n=1 Tax=Mangrovibacter yixingensis TaxID=1529639 RepID=UPI001CFA36DD|nr:FGGY-family carbohydrate kinase [Mangrovibacter yixingensis]